MGEESAPLLNDDRAGGAGRAGASQVLAVSMRQITKRFPGVLANDRVDFEAEAGEVHALLGENGAGKTTLMNVLTGIYRPDAGEIRIHDEPVQFHSPRDALDAGIGMVHQHFRLVETQTVAENMILGWHTPRFWLGARAGRRQVREVSDALQMPVDPDARIWQLSVGEQQRVEIIKAVFRGSRVLILDEPTAVLTPQEATQLFKTLRIMAARGALRDRHHTQAARGDGRRRPDNRSSRRRIGRDRLRVRGDTAFAGGAHGRPRDRRGSTRSTEASGR